jgi:hypothetical protein
MKRGLTCSLLAVLFIVGLIPVLTPVEQPLVQVESLEVPTTPREMTPSATYNMQSLWDNLYASISVASMREIVRRLSEDYPNRVWYAGGDRPSDTLEDAWAYLNSTLRSFTGNQLSFKLITNDQSLIAIKNGTEPNNAPIIISGIASSWWTPGANTFGASAAAVLECARILNSVSLTNDVYFILINRLPYGYHEPNQGTQAMSGILDILEEQHRKPAVLYWFSTLLYESIEVNGDKILFTYQDEDSGYDRYDYLLNIMEMASDISGDDRFLPWNAEYSNTYTLSGAYDAKMRDIPGFVVGQTYGDPWSGGDYDEWDVWGWDYNRLYDAVGMVVSAVGYIGKAGTGDAPAISVPSTLSVGEIEIYGAPLMGLSYVNITVAWSGSTEIVARIIDPFGATVYTRTSNSSPLHLQYLVQDRGIHLVNMTNIGSTSVSYTVSLTHWQDYDMDDLDDWEEFNLGTDSLSADSDADLLDDNDELIWESDPLVRDTDIDGAIDGLEIIYGSHPLIPDSDGDTVLDGFEIHSGMDPTNIDSDGDGIHDGVELANGYNPLSDDSDNDGLTDSHELQVGTDPIQSDSDGDGLSDLFEVLNGLNALSIDTDGDGLTDLFEVEAGLKPFDIDSDADGIPDGQDWDPSEHWMTSIPLFTFVAFVAVFVIWLYVKRRNYLRGA